MEFYTDGFAGPEGLVITPFVEIMAIGSGRMVSSARAIILRTGLPEDLMRLGYGYY